MFEVLKAAVDLKITHCKGKDGYWELDKIFERLVEEVGELARSRRSSEQERNRDRNEDEEAEVIGIIFTAIAYANKAGMNLEDAWLRQMNCTTCKAPIGLDFVFRSADEKDDETGEPLYWSNALGWVDRASATVFKGHEWDAANQPANSFKEEIAPLPPTPDEQYYHKLLSELYLLVRSPVFSGPFGTSLYPIPHHRIRFVQELYELLAGRPWDGDYDRKRHDAASLDKDRQET